MLERAQEVEKSVNSTDYTDMQLSSSHTPGTTETATLDVKALEAAKQISKNLRRVADCILNKHRLVFLACADENSLASILEHSTKRLSALHEVTEDAPLPDSIFTCPRRSAAAIDSPLEEVRMTGDFGNVSEFMGRHLPFCWLRLTNILNLLSAIRAVPMTAVWIFSCQTGILPCGALPTHGSALLLKHSPLQENSLKTWRSVRKTCGAIF